MLQSGNRLLFAWIVSGSALAFASAYRPGEVLVKYKDGVFRTQSTMEVLYQSVGVKKIQRYPKFMRGLEQLTLNDEASVEAAIQQLKRDRSVEYAQPNYLLFTLPIEEEPKPKPDFQGCLESPFSLNGSCVSYFTHLALSEESKLVSDRPPLHAEPTEIVPSVDDPDLRQLWGLSKIQAPQAWQSHRGSKAFIVADIDTGIDYNHEDLSFNLWRNPNPSEKNDVVGFDFVHNDGLPFDDQEHGTHTAGTIGAVGGNGLGISGVAQQVSLMALKFIAKDGSGTTADAIRAIDYAVNHGARVLSNSWGGQGDSDNRALSDAIDRAQSKGVLFIAAAGNSSADNDDPESASYPAAFGHDNLISVAATDRSDDLAYFSNYGKKTTHLAAPGDKIYSTVPGNRYRTMSGTSMACPHVAGAAALIWSKHPEWDYKKVKEVLLSTVDLLPALNGKTITGGRLNVQKALTYPN